MGNSNGNPQQPPTPPKHILTLKEAEGRINPYKMLLDQCIQHGWDAYNQDYKHKHHILRPRSRATIIFDEIVYKAAEVFHALAGVNFKPYRNSFFLYIGDDIVVRFKKIKKNGRCSSISTHQQSLFQMQIEIPGMEKGTMLQAGYVLDDLQHQLVRKLVVCEFDKRVLWTIELMREASAPVMEMPLAPTPEPPKHRFESKPEAVPESEKEKKKHKRKGA
jgi:hypothetical protein